MPRRRLILRKITVLLLCLPSIFDGKFDWTPKDLDRIVVAEGPGSYTGLRIAVATAKTLAYTLNIELVGMSSLLALVPYQQEGLFVPLMDARRNNVYAGFYENAKPVMAEAHLPFERVIELIKGASQVTFVGEVGPFVEQIQNTCQGLITKKHCPMQLI